MQENFTHGWNSEPEVGETLAALIKLTGAKNVIECGTFQGATTLQILAALPEDGKLITIDIEDNRCKTLKESKDPRLTFIQKSTLKALPEIEIKADLIFYDTVHEYKHQVAEFKLGEKVAAINCVHAFHDSIHMPGVLQFVNWMRSWYHVINLQTPGGRGLAVATRHATW